jgi:hypothetical protein
MHKELRPIPGHRQYVISIDGTVFRVAGGRDPHKPLKSSLRKAKGYEGVYVSLSTKDMLLEHIGGDEDPITDYLDPRPYGVHRLVALAWIGPQPEGKTLVIHKDGDVTNNHAGNLMYASASERTRHRAKLGRPFPKGKDHWNFGKEITEESRALMSEAKKGESHPKFKGHYCHALTGEKYPSLREASKATGQSAAAITKALTEQPKDPKKQWLFIPKPREDGEAAWIYVPQLLIASLPAGPEPIFHPPVIINLMDDPETIKKQLEKARETKL